MPNLRFIGGVCDGVDVGVQKCYSCYLTLKARFCESVTSVVTVSCVVYLLYYRTVDTLTLSVCALAFTGWPTGE